MNLYELIVIAVVALLVFGPDKLPDLAYRVARFWRTWQNMTDEFNQQINRQMYFDEIEDKKNKIEQDDKVVDVIENKSEKKE